MGILDDYLFGISYEINNKNINIENFTPAPISNRTTRRLDSLSRLSYPFNLYRMYLHSPFFLPLKLGLRGSFDYRLKSLSKMLQPNEYISITFAFERNNKWKETAIDMYSSYLMGNNHPSSINMVREISDYIYDLKNKIFGELYQREYSGDVENKILDDGYLFECYIRIRSERSSALISIIEDGLNRYDYMNKLIIESVDDTSFNTRKGQILSKSEIMSLLYISEYDTVEGDGEIANDKDSDILSILPTVQEADLKIDDTLTDRLNTALIKLNLINEDIDGRMSQGARRTFVEFNIPENKKFSDVKKIEKDIQVEMGATSLEILQGDRAGSVKVSVPNSQQQTIGLKKLITDINFTEFSYNNPLSFIAGVDEDYRPIYLSLEKLRHILITGSQGSGKSVFLNQILTTFTLTYTPEELNLILIDPKRVELQQYEGLPHVKHMITNMNKALPVLNKLVNEMNERYEIFKNSNVKDIQGYNEGNTNRLPYKICVIEEWADLYSTAGKDIEKVVLRLGQMARAAGIFLIIVTQRPSAKILSGDIKGNIQSKFSFNLGNNTNYKTVFDTGIPYKLLGKGDGVMRIEGLDEEFVRFQSPIISTSQREESRFFEDLGSLYKDYDIVSHYEEVEDGTLAKLKSIIANTGETRVSMLRDKLRIKTERLSELMNELVKEGWLDKGVRSKGYKLIATDEMMERYLD